MDVMTGILSKRAIREFKPEPVPPDVIETILRAGQHAQSSKNTQPWQFVLVSNRDTLEALAKCGVYAGHIAGAAFAVALAPVEAITGFWVAFDLGQAAAYLQLAAWELGVGSCIAALHEPERAASILGLPDDRRLDVVISFGYPVRSINAEALVGKANRRPLDKIVRREHW